MSRQVKHLTRLVVEAWSSALAGRTVEFKVARDLPRSGVVPELRGLIGVDPTSLA